MCEPDPYSVSAPDAAVRVAEIGADARPLLIEKSRQWDALTGGDVFAWLGTHRPWLDTRLQTAGALLFRGFGIERAAALDAFAQVTSGQVRPYTEGQSQRSRVEGLVYTSTEYPADQDITLHNELSYTHDPPLRLAFCCTVAPTNGGQTPIADGRQLWATLEPALRDRFSERQVRYVKVMHGGQGLGKSWQEHFETEDHQIVEAYLNTASVEFEWRDDGALWTAQVRPAVRIHPQTGEIVWFNQADLWHYTNLGATGEALLGVLGETRLPTNAYYGDGSAIDPSDLATIRRLRWSQATRFDWQVGDALLLDNLLVSHGRTAFRGDRRVLVVMV